jgi:hypothetical protein
MLGFGPLPADSADKYATYGTLSVFGANQSQASCAPQGGIASVRFAVRGSYDNFLPNNLAMLEGPNSVRFSFNVGLSGDDFSARPAPPPLSLEAWRTYPNFGAGPWNIVSIQKLSNGERLSDAIRHTTDTSIPGCASASVKVAEVLTGDMQVSTVGSAFPIPSISVRVRTDFPEAASVGASAVLASQVIVDEALDTGIDGPKTALLTDNTGTVSFAVTPGTRPGVKRFIVKARHPYSAASAMATLVHAPVGAPVANSVPIVEYSYDGGAGAPVRYLTGTAAVTRQLDSRDEAKLFTRTGQVWRAFTDVAAAPGLAPVCQFFGRLTSTAAVSHFFTANAQECASLRAAWGDAGSAGPGLKYEGVAFYAVAPDAQQRCPSAFPIQIKRYFVASPSPYHEYFVVDQKTQEPPFSPRGTPDGTAFCTDVATAF